MLGETTGAAASGPRALRVAVVTTQWGPPWNEGVRNLARCLVEFLSSKGAQVSVVAPRPRRHRPGGAGLGRPLVRSVAFTLAAAERARRLHVDVVILIASVSAVLGLRSWALRRWSGAPLVLYVTGQRPLTYGYRFLQRAEAVLVNSPALASFFPGADLVPPFTDARRWHPTVRREVPRPPVILFLGAFERCRGVEYLIQAMDHLPRALEGAVLRLAWNGVGRDHYPSIRRAIRESGARDRIELTESTDVRRLYAEAAVVIIPRIAPERMAFPVRIIEAVSMGVPLIVTQVNRMDELVAGCGLAVPPRDAGALAEAIARLLTDRELYSRLAAGCLDKARAWDSTRSLDTIYRTALRCL
jgi:glycosyltransferase involved in cell wall biosynthesis